MSFIKTNGGFLLGLCLISLAYNAELGDPALDPAIGEVVKNITKVNTLLRDLIKNYEKLQKMSQPESIESYDDDEIKQLFNDNNKTKRKKHSKKITSAAKTIRIHATAIEVSDEEKEIKKDEENDETKIVTLSMKPKKRVKKQENMNEEQQTDSQKDNMKNYGDKSGEESALEREHHLEETSQKSTNFKGISARLKKIAKKLFAAQLDLSEETTTRNRTTNTLPSTIFGVTITSFPKIVRPRSKTTEVIRQKKKILEPNIGRHGTTRSLIVKDKGEMDRMPVFNAKDIKPPNPKKKKLEPAIELSDFDSGTIEESKVIQKEEYKTDVLRQAYGDACLKLVIRKCYMACKAVYKDVCHGRHKCSPEYRTSFKKHAIFGCDSHFQNNSVSFRGKDSNQDDNAKGLADMTREGYLSMACGPTSFSKVGSFGPDWVRRFNQQTRNLQIIMRGLADRQSIHLDSHKTPNQTSTEIKQMKPILRDKYELACQQASRAKCYKACKYAENGSCDEEKCSKKKKEALDKSCKTRCKQSYGGKDSDDDSDSEDSDSESEEEKKEKADAWR